MRLKDLVIMLETNDIEASERFYTDMLGFVLQGKYYNAEGACTWINLQKDNVVLYFTIRWSKTPVQTNMTGSLYFYPEDVDILWKSIKDKVTVSYPIEDFHYGMREFGILDNNGYLLQFGQEIE